MTEDNGAGFVSGFFAGAALGAMAAILLTPRSGRELREEILSEGERARDRAYGTAREARERGDEALDKTRETLQEAAEGLKEVADVLRSGKKKREAAAR